MKKFLLFSAILLSLVFTNAFNQVYNDVIIYTPTGKAVNAQVLVSGDLTPQQKLDSKNFWLQCYNYRITYINEATRTYNCHGYAWHYLSSGGYKVWIKKPEQQKYWQCGGYGETTQSVGTRVSFGGPCNSWKTNCDGTSYADWCDHSAYTINTSGRLRSKWGQCPLFDHDIADCPYTTSDLHFYSLITLTGPDPLCTSDYYTVNNLPAGTTVNWLPPTSNISRVSDQYSNPCIFQKVSNGNGYIYADLTSGCETIHLSIPVHTGPYSSSDYPISGPTSALCHSYVYYSIPSLPGATSINWVWPSGWTYVSGQGTTYLSLYTGLYSGIVQVGVNNTCGQSGSYHTEYVYIYGNCGYGFSLYPNPSSDEVTITINESTSIATENLDVSDVKVTKVISNDQTIYTIRIYNSQGTLLLTATRSGTSFKIPLNNMSDGTYIVELSDGKNNYREPLIIKHE
jgi:hypothetical protein